MQEDVRRLCKYQLIVAMVDDGIEALDWVIGIGFKYV